MISLPSNSNARLIAQQASKSMADRMFRDESTGKLQPRICATCDEMVTILNPSVLVPIKKLIKRLHKAKAHHHHVRRAYENPAVVDSYKASHPSLSPFVLSPATHVRRLANGSECVLMCRTCKDEMESKCTSRKKHVSPERAIWNYNLVGELPECLKILRPAEVAIISPNHIYTHAIVLRSDRHDGIYGWHSMFENRVDVNIGNTQYLIDAGLEGEIVCVFCGPFDKAQVDAARTQYSIRPQKVIEAFDWLKKNNHYFRDFEIPDASRIQPVKFHFADDL